jgi:hypothetical protein
MSKHAKRFSGVVLEIEPDEPLQLLEMLKVSQLTDDFMKNDAGNGDEVPTFSAAL